MSQDLIALLKPQRPPRILIVGDVILDRYLWGNVERISPEAPIPLLRVAKKESRLGGAGSVAAMLAALEADVRMVTAVGDDLPGQEVARGILDLGIANPGIVTIEGRPTTVKERLLGRAQSRHPQQMIRVDYEDDGEITTEHLDQLLEHIEQQLEGVDLVLLSDYNKGVCADRLITRLVQLARERNCPVVADPIRGGDYRRYAGCCCITPNRLEASLATGMKIDTPEDGVQAALQLIAMDIDAVIVTMDRDGMVWATRDGQQGHLPVRPQQVYDITGAGDMVLAVIGYTRALDASYPQMIELANVAGGMEVQRLGAVPVTRDELLQELSFRRRDSHSKLMTLPKLLDELAARRESGARIVMTNGCFDLMHPGHVASLALARSYGDCLVVGLNSDVSVRALKGEGRPLIDELGRAEMLSALESVDHIVLFDEVSVTPLIEQVRPEVLVKSNQYDVEGVVGHEVVQSYGGRIVLTPMKGDYSTSGLIEKIRQTPEQTASGPLDGNP